MQRFVDEEMIPVEMESIGDDGELKPEWREKFHARAKELGIWKMEVPEEYGGMGADLMSLVIVWEQLGRTVAVPTRGLGGIMGPQVRAPLYELSEEMKELRTARQGDLRYDIEWTTLGEFLEYLERRLHSCGLHTTGKLQVADDRGMC